MARNTGDLRGNWAVVTGASSGLGREFVVQLAAMGMHVVAAARRRERLEELEQEVSDRFGTRILPVSVDLSDEVGTAKLCDAVRAESIEPLVLVNNAGFGLQGPFLSIPWEQERTMLSLDIVSLVALTRQFGAGMASRGRGYIVQVSSLGAYLPTPTYSSYTAAKAYVRHHGEAIRHELRGSGVSVTVVSPGITATEFQEVAGQEPTLYQRLVMMQPDRVVRVGIRAMLRRRASVVPGVLNKLSVAIIHFLPRGIVARAAETLMR